MVFEHFSFIIFWIGTFRFAGLFQLSYPPGFDNTSWIKNTMYVPGTCSILASNFFIRFGNNQIQKLAQIRTAKIAVDLGGEQK